MEFLNENLWLVWLIAGIFFLIVEIVTTALVSIWFVPAAAITCGISFLVDSLLWQTVIFILLSAVFMIWFRRICNPCSRGRKGVGNSPRGSNQAD